MFSIRNAKLFAIAAMSAMSVVGCQAKKSGDLARLSPEPTIPELSQSEHMRNWDQSKAVYANGSVPAGDDRFRLQASDSTVDDWGWLTETPIFAANCVIFPFTYITSPPNSTIYAPSVVTPPTFTAMPPTEVIPAYGVEADGRRGSSGGSQAR